MTVSIHGSEGVSLNGIPIINLVQIVPEQNFGESGTSSTSEINWSNLVSITPKVAGSTILGIFNPGVILDVDNDDQGANNGRLYGEYKVGDSDFSSGQQTLFSSNYINVPGRGANGSQTYFHKIITTSSTDIIYFRLGIMKSEGSRSILFRDGWATNSVIFMEYAS